MKQLEAGHPVSGGGQLARKSKGRNKGENKK
jgi:hypothetical protein